MQSDYVPQPIACFDVLDVAAELPTDVVLDNMWKAGFPATDVSKTLMAALLPTATALLKPQSIGRLYEAAALHPASRQRLPEPIRSADYLLFAVATAGRSVDDEAARLRSNGDLVNSMVLDAIALTALCEATAHLMAAVRDWARSRTLGISRAVAPGSGGDRWDLPNQDLLFAHVPAGEIGVELTPAFWMLPTKSTSFALGMGRDIQDVKDPFSCMGCPRLDCPYRHDSSEEMITIT